MRLVNIVFVILIYLLSAGCGGAGDDAEPVIRVGLLKGPTAMSLIRMLDSPPVLDNMKTGFVLKGNPMLLRPMLFREELDMAVIPTTMAAMLYNKGLPYRAAAVTIRGTLSLVGDGESLREWEDLRGKKIYVMGKGMTPDILFRYLLDRKGLQPGKDVTLKYNFPGPLDLGRAAAAGRASPAVVSEPLGSLIRMKNKNLSEILDLTEEWRTLFGESVPLCQTVLVVRSDFAREYPGKVAAFLALYKESIRWINAHPREAGEMIALHGIVPDAGAAADSIPRCHFDYQDAYPIRDRVSAYLEVFYRFNPDTVGGKIPDEGFYYRK